MYIKINNIGNGFIKGSCDKFNFSAKVFDTESKFGIDKGRISKLSIRDNFNNMLVNYDRGWDIEPEGEYVIDCYKSIMKELENI